MAVTYSLGPGDSDTRTPSRKSGDRGLARLVSRSVRVAHAATHPSVTVTGLLLGKDTAGAARLPLDLDLDRAATAVDLDPVDTLGIEFEVVGVHLVSVTVDLDLDVLVVV